MAAAKRTPVSNTVILPTPLNVLPYPRRPYRTMVSASGALIRRAATWRRLRAAMRRLGLLSLRTAIERTRLNFERNKFRNA
jgi:hypothetical protein